MAEAVAVVSFISAVAALIKVGSTVVGRLNNFRERAHEVPEVFKHLKAQLPITINSLQRTSAEAQAGNVDSDTQMALTPALEGCQSQIRRLDEILDQVLPADKDSSWTRKTKALRSISKDKEVRSLLQELDRYLLRLVLHNTSGTSRALPQSLSARQVSMIPAKRDPNFIDRPRIFEELQSNLTHYGRAALAGIGGVGKTQIAIELCHRFLETHPEAQILWAHAGTLTKFVQACKHIAENLRLPGWNDQKGDVLQLVRHWLTSNQNGKWLFILDNIDDIQLLDQPLPSSVVQNSLIQYFPRATNGVIIFTTRDNRVGERLAVRGKTTIVSTMTTTESVQLLRSYLVPSMNVAVDDIEMVVEALDRLPLAITQAAAYITEQVITVEDYFSMLQEGDEDMQELLSESLDDDRRTDRESNSVIKTWKLSFDLITKQSPRAAQMLSLMAMFDRQGIPPALFKHKDEPKRVFMQALAMLQNFSLVNRGAHSETYEMHRLVQLSTQAWLEVQNTTTFWKHEALHTLVEQFPNGNKIENWRYWEALAPHARTMLQFDSLPTDALLDRAKLLEHLASFDRYRNHNETALIEAKESMEIFERLRGLESSETLSSMTTYAMCLEARGEGQKAQGLLRRSSAAQEQLLGPDHPDTLRSLSRLTWTLYKLRNLDEAEDLQRRIVSIRGHLLGSAHSLVLRDMVNLAVTLISLGKYEEAEEFCRGALLMHEKSLVTDHHNTTQMRHNLAWCLSHRKKYDEATEQYRHVLSLREGLLGAHHRYTLKCRQSLALCLYNQKRYDEAVQHYRLIFASKEKLPGPDDDPEAQECRAEYARCLCMSGNSDEAIEQYQLVFSSSAWLDEAAFVDILRRRHSYAWCLSNSERYDEAVEQYRIILASRDQNSAIPDLHGITEVAKVEKGLTFCLGQLALSRAGATSAVEKHI